MEGCSEKLSLGNAAKSGRPSKANVEFGSGCNCSWGYILFMDDMPIPLGPTGTP